jgi:hypothetical protein
VLRIKVVGPDLLAQEDVVVHVQELVRQSGDPVNPSNPVNPCFRLVVDKCNGL